MCPASPPPQSPHAVARGHRWLGEAMSQDNCRAAPSSRPGGSSGHPGPRAEWALSLSITNTRLVCRFLCLFPQAVSVLLLIPLGSASGRHLQEPWLREFLEHCSSPSRLGDPKGREVFTLCKLIWKDKTCPRSKDGTSGISYQGPGARLGGWHEFSCQPCQHT